MDDTEPRLGEDRSGLVGGSTGLHHDPDDIVRNQHERVHHASQVQRLERSYISRCDRNDGPRVLDPELEPLLPLDPFNDLVRPHDLDRVRVWPRPDTDPVSPNDDSAGDPADDGCSVLLRPLHILEWIGVDGECMGEFGGSAKRRCVEVGGGGGREDEEKHKPGEAEAEN